ncbi:DUF58 domain-containing protein [Salinicoccus kekensis]|uniref:DUF58 domain-containing protein n=1 Tax=Salinicoccus kekensis TaxID=714307 RepID=A0A285UK33_9STAP|nr:DUF58 domain-containing protein [Salinicoccus kekensis]SOC42172.1 uncharacterized protein SAMN05878391_1546 [Salinicoccus kekensis]
MKYKRQHTESKMASALFSIIAVMVIFDLLYTAQLNAWLQLIIGITAAMALLNLFHEKNVAKHLTVDVMPGELRKYKGQEDVLYLQVTQRGRLPVLSAEITITAGDDIAFYNDESLKIRNVTETSRIFSVFPGKSTTIEIPFKAVHRGTSKIIETKIAVPRIFGFGHIKLEQAGSANHEILIYPDRYALHNRSLKAKIEQGAYRDKNTFFHDPLLTTGSRPYETTDSLRDVHWKLSARSGELMTREYEKTTHMSWLFLINLRSDKSFAPPADIEVTFEKLAFIFGTMAEDGIPYRIMANMRTFDRHQFFTLDESSGKLHYRHALEALARIKTVTYTISFDRFLKFVKQSDKMPTHLIFTGEADPLIMAELKYYIEQGTAVYQLDEHGLEPFKYGRKEAVT